MKQNTARQVSGKKVAIAIVLALVLLIAGAVLYTLKTVQTATNLQLSNSQIIILMHGVQNYAAENDDRYPTQEQWPDDLIAAGIIDEELMISPAEDGDDVSYIYIPGPFTTNATQILIYEDPKHWPKEGVLVGFADNHVEFVPFEEFDQMLRAQQLREINLLKSITYIRGLMIAAQSYANNANDGVLPSQSEWPDELASWMNMDLLVSPVEDGDGISYTYVPGENTLNADQILVYEDPKHWPKRGVLVGFADNHVEFVPFADFDRMLTTQLETNASAP